MNSQLDHFLVDEIAVVVRSVRERTESACVAAIVAQGIQPENIVVINEAPFSEALRSSFVVGLKSGRKWTLCVDADVLLRPWSISTLLAHAQRQPESTCCVQGLMLDKFTVAIRAGGIHLYRTAHLRAAIREIPVEGKTIRPESFVHHQMERSGHPWATVPYVVGIHDFGQYYKDIFRKCYVYANKHLIHLPDLLPVWRKSAEDDQDFAVALEGVACGIRERGTIYIDNRVVSVTGGFTALKLDEKGVLAPGEFSLEAIESQLNRWAADNVPVHGFSVTAGEAIKFGPDSHFRGVDRFLRIFGKKVEEIGLVRTIPFVVGTGIERLGLLIKRISSKREEPS